MFTETNGVVAYDDSQVKVTVNVDPTKDGIKFEYHRNVDCIKIKAFSPKAKFIQFVTRQYPDIYTYKKSQGKTLLWDPVASFYMTDSINPKWKLDVIEDSKTCFYEDGGLSHRDEVSTSMYDDPGGLYLPEEDRAAFCTFVVVNNQTTHLVQWSKQAIVIENQKEPVECYMVNVIPWGNKPLPFWALQILKNFYNSKDNLLPKEIASQDIIEELSKKLEDEFIIEARNFFLKPPDNWVTILNFPELFLEKNLIEKKEIQKEEKKIDLSSELEKMTLLEDESIVSKEKEFKPLITQFEKTILKKEEELLQEDNEQVEDLKSKETTKLFKK